MSPQDIILPIKLILLKIYGSPAILLFNLRVDRLMLKGVDVPEIKYVGIFAGRRQHYKKG